MSLIKNYYELCKPNVVLMMLLCALVGIILASDTLLPLIEILVPLVGIGLCSGSAAAINQIIDREADAEMSRTDKRPIPQGEISVTNASIFAFVIGVLGVLILVYFVNSLTAILTIFALGGYAFIYTIFLKRATPQNIVIGGLAGAAPPLLGWASVTNTIEPNALILVLIIFIWTPPHFWALALYRSGEYARAEVPMMNEVKGAEYTLKQSKIYCVLLFLLGSVPCFWPESGLPLLWAFIAGGLTLWYSISVWQIDPNEEFDSNGRMPKAAKSFFRSLYYLGWMFILLVIICIIPPDLLGWLGPLDL